MSTAGAGTRRDSSGRARRPPDPPTSTRPSAVSETIPATSSALAVIVRSYGAPRRMQMATQKDVRAIALSLPQVRESVARFAFGVVVKDKWKGFVWAWNERLEPGKPRIP